MNRFIITDSLPERVIMTDDPARVRAISSHYVDRVETMYEHRGMIGCSGEYQGVALAMISCGFGESAAILYLEEAVSLGARELIYLGEGISLTRGVNLMDVVIPKGGSQILEKLIVTIANSIPIPVKMIETITYDRFWCSGVNVQEERGWDITDFAAGAVQAVSSARGVSAAVILTISENSVTDERVSEETRQVGFNEASVLALRTLSDLS